jgi:hypothetical protein
MGRCFEFKCSNPSCGYVATVSGGKDMGLCGEVETMVCLDCEKLMDFLPAAMPNLKLKRKKYEQ